MVAKSTSTACSVASIAGCANSIEKRSLKPKCGSRRAHLSPSRTSTGRFTLMKRLAARCSTMPADWTRNTNEPADPSRIGISGAVTSTYRLSMPRPASADIRCSTVATRTWLPGPSSAAVSVDAMRVSVTRAAPQRISTGGSRSVRLNTIPVSASAGRKVSSTRSPECRPTPVVLTGILIVRWRIMGTSAVSPVRAGRAWSRRPRLRTCPALRR